MLPSDESNIVCFNLVACPLLHSHSHLKKIINVPSLKSAMYTELRPSLSQLTCLTVVHRHMIQKNLQDLK